MEGRETPNPVKSGVIKVKNIATQSLSSDWVKSYKTNLTKGQVYDWGRRVGELRHKGIEDRNFLEDWKKLFAEGVKLQKKLDKEKRWMDDRMQAELQKYIDEQGMKQLEEMIASYAKQRNLPDTWIEQLQDEALKEMPHIQLTTSQQLRRQRVQQREAVDKAIDAVRTKPDFNTKLAQLDKANTHEDKKAIIGEIGKITEKQFLSQGMTVVEARESTKAALIKMADMKSIPQMNAAKSIVKEVIGANR